MTTLRSLLAAALLTLATVALKLDWRHVARGLLIRRDEACRAMSRLRESRGAARLST